MTWPRVLAAALALCAEAAEPRERLSAAAFDLDESDACQNCGIMVSALQRDILRAVRTRNHAVDWQKRIDDACAFGCDRLLPSSSILADELADIAKSTTDVRDSSVSVESLAKALCGADGVLGLCPTRHSSMPPKVRPYAVDASFSNAITGGPLYVVKLSNTTVGADDAAPRYDLRAEVAPGAVAEVRVFEGETLYVGVPDPEEPTFLPLTFGPDPFYAFELHERSDWDKDTPFDLPVLDAVKPVDWDEGAFGPWPLPTIPNPEAYRRDKYFLASLPSSIALQGPLQGAPAMRGAEL
ncbi:hypothetical protein M885DRAFT_536820 [Pelagophyceae sp. CCMP2097]|nr:hypothetical protein M885DRAFT_536820 [Pelagophyceae sp. CCMP2097]